jgi:hypothetical protein
MTLTDYKTAELFSRESSNWLFAKNALLVGALSSVVVALPYAHLAHKGNYYGYTNATSGTSQTSMFMHSMSLKKPFMPRTDLGKKLLELRNKAIAKGMPLLDQDDILLEVQKRRGLIE